MEKMKISINLALVVIIILLNACSESKKNEKPTEQTNKTDKSQVKSNDLTKYGIAEFPKNVLGGLKVGETAPDFKLKNENGEMISLTENLKNGPVVLVFYRADWCPYCTKHLAEFQDKINGLKETDKANVIAISPQMPKYSKALSEENGYTFPILYDEDHVVMKDYKVFFRVTEEYNEKILKFKGEYIQTRNGDTDPYLPIPATYVIGQDQRIKFVHYDPNYKVRANVEEALGAIK